MKQIRHSIKSILTILLAVLIVTTTIEPLFTIYTHAEEELDNSAVDADSAPTASVSPSGSGSGSHKWYATYSTKGGVAGHGFLVYPVYTGLTKQNPSAPSGLNNLILDSAHVGGSAVPGMEAKALACHDIMKNYVGGLVAQDKFGLYPIVTSYEDMPVPWWDDVLAGNPAGNMGALIRANGSYNTSNIKTWLV